MWQIRAPVSLITAHRILIGSAIAFFAFYGLWELRNFSGGAGAGAIARAAIAFAVAAGFGLYLRTVKPRDR